MFVLYTNHFRELSHLTITGVRLRERLASATEPVTASAVVAEEVLRGWLSKLSSIRDVTDQILAYKKLSDAVNMLADYTMLPWDNESAARFKVLPSTGHPHWNHGPQDRLHRP